MTDPAQEPEAVAPLREARPSIPEDGFNCIWLMENGHQVGCLDGAQNEPAVIARAQHWSRPVSLDREAVKAALLKKRDELVAIPGCMNDDEITNALTDAIVALFQGSNP
jgi:hypothetical protein